MNHLGFHTGLDRSCTDCKLRYPKEYTWKQWCDFRKMDSVRLIDGKEYYRDAQEALCRKYNVTIIDYQTPRERKIQMMKKFFGNVKSSLQGIKSALAKIHESNQKRKTLQKRTKKKNVSKILNYLTMSEKEYAMITGRSTEKDLDFITGSRTKKDLSYILSKNSRDYSALLGKPRRNRKRQKKYEPNLEKFWGKRK